MKNKNNNFISIVLYVCNSSNNIEKFLSTIHTILNDNFKTYEIICVNDYSKDNSVEIIKNFAKNIKTSNITVVNLNSHYGLEQSMNVGVNFSIGDFIFEFDTSKIDYKENVIMDVYEKALEGFDIVSASSNKTEKFSSRVFYFLYKKFSSSKKTIKSETFRLLSRRAINRINGMNKTIPYRKAVYYNCGLRTTSIEYKPTLIEKEKIDSKYRFDLGIDCLVLFTNAGYKISIGMVLSMLLIALIVSVYSIIVYISGNPVEGWTTTILFLSIAFFGLFVLLAVVIKYLQILVDLNNKKSNYLFESVEKL